MNTSETTTKSTKLTPQEAALYLGHKCICQQRPLEELLCTIGEAVLYDLRLGVKYQLLLRPLSDITEEEANEFGYSKHLWGFASERGKLDLTPQKFIKALGMGFDLFNFIQQGKALDKTKVAHGA